MGPQQLVLDLPSRAAQGREDFFVSPSNAVAVAALERWPNWPARKLALCGPASSGKSHLAQVWAALSGGAVVQARDLGATDIEPLAARRHVTVEDVDDLAGLDDTLRAAAEEVLFHLHNRLLAEGGTLLVTGSEAPARWNIRLPDLASRLAACEVVRMESPDDNLLSAILVKQFTDRQLQVTPDVIRYLVSRMERSFQAARDLVAELDRASLARQRPITLPLARAVLAGQDG